MTLLQGHGPATEACTVLRGLVTECCHGFCEGQANPGTASLLLAKNQLASSDRSLYGNEGGIGKVDERRNEDGEMKASMSIIKLLMSICGSIEDQKYLYNFREAACGCHSLV